MGVAPLRGGGGCGPTERGRWMWPHLLHCGAKLVNQALEVISSLLCLGGKLAVLSTKTLFLFEGGGDLLDLLLESLQLLLVVIGSLHVDEEGKE